MSLLESLAASLPPSTLSLEEVIVGPRCTFVVSSHCGLAAMPPDGHGPAARLQLCEGLSGSPLKDLLPLASSSRPSEASLGVAAMNALLQENLKPASFHPYSIPRAGGKSVGLVGEFAFTEHLKALAADVITVEKDAAERVLPGVDIAIISDVSIVDHSLQALLAASASCYTIVFGPSTPLSPILFDYGADQLVGIRVENRQATADWVASGEANLMECPGLRSVVLRKSGEH